MAEIIDAHVHIGRYHLPIEHIDSLLKREGISRAVVFADPESDDMFNDSTYVLEAAKRMGYYPFYYYGGNAYSGQRPYKQLPVPDNLNEYSGIKWHCWFSPAHDGGLRYSYPIDMDNVRRQMDAPDFQAVMAAIQTLKFAMTFEEHFEVTCEFVRRYPDVQLIIPHMGMLNGGQERVQTHFQQFPNIHFDTSLGQVNESIVQALGASRLLYGCDHPYGMPADNLRRVQRLKISEEEKELILEANVKRLVRAHPDNP
jgi:uncharacterized protein